MPGYRAGVQGAAGELYADYYVRFGARNPPPLQRAPPTNTHPKPPTLNAAPTLTKQELYQAWIDAGLPAGDAVGNLLGPEKPRPTLLPPQFVGVGWPGGGNV